jgi:FdhD protein
MDQSSNSKEIRRWEGSIARSIQDIVAAEEPLEIRLMPPSGAGWQPHPLSITMRTPGQDEFLCRGFLYTEGIIHAENEINGFNIYQPGQGQDIVVTRMDVQLSGRSTFVPEQQSRNFFMASSCGICGKPGLDHVCQDFPYLCIPEKPNVTTSTLYALSEKLANHAPLFTQTGGVHAAFLLDKEGTLIDVQEDIGRHNALDKLIGKQLYLGNIPLQNHFVILSGRIGFELVQKALRAGIPCLIALGAASEGAIRLAETHGMTLAGFLKSDRVNVYCDQGRISE